MYALAILMYALPIIWAIAVLVRLGDNNKLLKRIADDMASIRRTTEDSGTLN